MIHRSIFWFAILTASITLQSSIAAAQAFGTKFVCCRSESVSCLGGGGATIWHTTLRDRALTQADAKLRCGFHKMYWATHSCPDSTECPDNANNAPAHATARVCNQMGNTIWVTVARRTFNDDKLTWGWAELGNGSCRDFNDFTDARVLYAAANDSKGREWFPNWKTNNLDDNATFCSNSTKTTTKLGVDKCHDKVQGYTFRTFGRISGIGGAYTFK